MSISETVAESVRRIRTEKRIPLTELSDLLTKMGQPIPVLGLRRIESDLRRLTVDELAALGQALGVPPIELMGEFGPEFVGAGYQEPKANATLTQLAAAVDGLAERLTALENWRGR